MQPATLSNPILRHPQLRLATVRGPPGRDRAAAGSCILRASSQPCRNSFMRSTGLVDPFQPAASSAMARPRDVRARAVGRRQSIAAPISAPCYHNPHIVFTSPVQDCASATRHRESIILARRWITKFASVFGLDLASRVRPTICMGSHAKSTQDTPSFEPKHVAVVLI